MLFSATEQHSELTKLECFIVETLANCFVDVPRDVAAENSAKFHC